MAIELRRAPFAESHDQALEAIGRNMQLGSRFFD
jgi:hypothetical protein